MKPPKRKRKGDRLLSPGASVKQIECDFAMAGFDEASRAMDRKWGIDRLPALCSADTAQKFGSAIAKLNAAIDSEDPDEVRLRAGVCHRGLFAMEKEATENGAQPVNPKFCQCEFEGKIFTVVQEISDLQNYEKAENEAVFTMREAAVLLKSLKMDATIIQQVKDEFPLAQITSLTKRLPDSFWNGGGDELPF